MSRIPNFLGNLPQFAATPRQDNSTNRLALLLQRLSNQDRVAQADRELESKEILTREQIQARLAEVGSQDQRAAAQIEAGRESDQLKAVLERERTAALEKGNELDVLASLANNPNLLPNDAIELFRAAGINVPESLGGTSSNLGTSDFDINNIEDIDSEINNLIQNIDKLPAGQRQAASARLRGLQDKQQRLDRQRLEAKDDRLREQEIARRELEKKENITLRNSENNLEEIQSIIAQSPDITDPDIGRSLISLYNNIQDKDIIPPDLRTRFTRDIIPNTRLRATKTKPKDLFTDEDDFTGKVSKSRTYLNSLNDLGVSSDIRSKKKNELVTDLLSSSTFNKDYSRETIPELLTAFREVGSIKFSDKDSVPVPVLKQNKALPPRGILADIIRPDTTIPESYKVSSIKYVSPEEAEKIFQELEQGNY